MKRSVVCIAIVSVVITLISLVISYKSSKPVMKDEVNRFDTDFYPGVMEFCCFYSEFGSEIIDESQVDLVAEQLTNDLSATSSEAKVCKMMYSVQAEPKQGYFPLNVQFNLKSDFEIQADTTYYWDFEGDGRTDICGTNLNQVSWTYNAEGAYSVKFCVSNKIGKVFSGVMDGFVGVLSTNIHFVTQNGSHTFPYSSLETASTNIESAVDAVMPGGKVLVSDGVYKLSRTLTLDKPVEVKSVNGAEKTVISGDGLFCCVHMVTNAVVEGFTLTDGYNVSGGGARINDGGCLRDCHVVGNLARSYGGGVYVANGGRVEECIISGNRAGKGGGVYSSSLIVNCLISDNVAGESGGGIYAGNKVDPSCGIVNCIIINNKAVVKGGGIYKFYRHDVSGSTILGNVAEEGNNYFEEYNAHSTFRNCNLSPAYTNGIGNVEFDPGYCNNQYGFCRL